MEFMKRMRLPDIGLIAVENKLLIVLFPLMQDTGTRLANVLLRNVS